MRRSPAMREAKYLMRFYERRGWNWQYAVEFVLAKYNGGIGLVRPCNHFKNVGRPRDK